MTAAIKITTTIRQYRWKSGLLQKEVVQILQKKGFEISVQEYSKIENNRLPISQELINTLFEILNIPALNN